MNCSRDLLALMVGSYVRLALITDVTSGLDNKEMSGIGRL
jgi:hypothetical protein